MLNLQGRQPDVPSAASEQLQLAANRVAAVARVHQNVYSDVAAVSCIAFLRRLCSDLSGIVGKPISVVGDEGDVDTIHLQPIGLLVNELVTNAAKNGANEIEVFYRINGGAHQLIVRDDGNGLPPDFDPEQSGSGLGMKVIRVLTDQLGGHMTAAPNLAGRGTSFEVTFHP